MVLEHVRPTAFNASDLTVSPAVVETGEEVSISANMSNNGDLSSTHDVTKGIDAAVVATKAVTVAVLDSEVITFSKILDVAGNYTVSIEEASGTLTVKAPEAPPEEAEAPVIPEEPVALEEPPVMLSTWLRGRITVRLPRPSRPLPVIAIPSSAIWLRRRRRLWSPVRELTLQLKRLLEGGGAIPPLR